MGELFMHAIKFVLFFGSAIVTGLLLARAMHWLGRRDARKQIESFEKDQIIRRKERQK